MNTNAAMLTGIGVGAGMAYLFDPALGRRRRAGVRDTLARAAHKSGDALEATSRDLMNRTRGLVAVSSGRGSREDSDSVLVDRVRAKLGRYVSHPRAIDVEAHDGIVTVHGPILTDEADRFLAAIEGLRGVGEVRDQLERHDEPGNVPALQGGSARPGERFALGEDVWSPTTRLLVGVAGVALVGVGMQRRHWAGAAISAVGSALVARALTDIELNRLVGVAAGRRAVDIQKTIHIDAPVSDVFAFWQYYENFPQFMSHVRSVTTRDGRSHWTVDGPLGVPIEFDAVTTRLVPDEVIAWRTEEGSPVAHAGTVRFEEADNGTTRVTVRFSYNPPAGAIGHAAAWLLGSDAKRLFDDDLARMKTLIETGRPARDAATNRETVTRP
jgi:uncharacterized membrane protein